MNEGGAKINHFLFFPLPLLEDVRSLSLPGSYCEKITHLGRSLMGFTRLKHLDLSRNAIESLDVSFFLQQHHTTDAGQFPVKFELCIITLSFY